MVHPASWQHGAKPSANLLLSILLVTGWVKLGLNLMDMAFACLCHFFGHVM